MQTSALVIEAFRRAAGRTPAAIALHAPTRSVTYAELEDRVNGVAAALRERGIGPGARVGIYLERSIEMITAVLGVLASGAAYVPLDPEYPAMRSRSCLEDANVSLLLAGPDGDALCAQIDRVTRFDPRDWPAAAPAFEVAQDGPAYLIYTSGSTGRPKGVVVDHAALGSYLAWCLEALPFTGAGVPLFGSISFDHVLTTLFPPLMRGEPLILLPPIQGGRALADGLLGGRSYSYVKITPSHLRLLDLSQRAALGRLTGFVMLGGERLPVELVTQLRRDNPELRVMNHYGPTEATVGCCTFLVPPGFEGSSAPIGRPLPQMRFSVRHEDGTLAPATEPGELYVSGAGLAREYWRRPDLTEKAFVEVIDADGIARRAYRTGDIVFQRSDGNFDYLGRADDQVKILGHRVEPMEVEALLRAHPAIADAAVLPIDRGDVIELIAAVTLRDATVDIEEIRRYARARLPSVMVPARVLLFDRLPVTGNGKLDRQQIRQRAAAESTIERQSNGTVEERLMAKWCEVLGVETIGPDDDFFDLGGDSLATVEIMTWASTHFHVTLDPPALFDFPTLRTLGARIHALTESR